MVFLNPHARTLQHDWESVARFVVGAFKLVNSYRWERVSGNLSLKPSAIYSQMESKSNLHQTVRGLYSVVQVAPIRRNFDNSSLNFFGASIGSMCDAPG